MTDLARSHSAEARTGSEPRRPPAVFGPVRIPAAHLKTAGLMHHCLECK